MHSGDSPYECDSCSEMFWEMALLREHQKIQHAGQSSNSEYEPDDIEQDDKDSDSDADSKYGVFYCSVCGMSFHRSDLLLRHQKTHTNSGAAATASSSYAEECESMNNALPMKHRCTVCSDSFVDALELLAHSEIHARFQPFK